MVTEPGPGVLREAGLDPGTARLVASGARDCAWAACADPASPPVGQGECEVSFLDCFHCANCVVTPGHLPRLLGLLGELGRRRELMDREQWWARYGPTWAALRHDVLARFTPEQVAAAGDQGSDEAGLDLVEAAWTAP